MQLLWVFWDELCDGLWCVLLASLCNTIKMSQSWDTLILVKIRMSIIRMWSFTLLFLPICISDFSSDIFLLLWVLSGWWCDIIKMFQRLVLSETTDAWLIVTTSVRSYSILGIILSKYNFLIYIFDPIRRSVGSFFVSMSTLRIVMRYN